MRVDLTRALEVVRTAIEFDWTWTVDDLPKFVARVDWQLEDLDQQTPTVTTNLDVNRTKAVTFTDLSPRHDGPRELQGLWFHFTDFIPADSSEQPLLSKAFEDLAQQIFDAFGSRPAEWWIEPTRGLRWDFPGIVVKVVVSDRFGDVELVSPAHQEAQDAFDTQLEHE
ncbi:DUF6301 family protein [Nocardia goodfellowii]